MPKKTASDPIRTLHLSDFHFLEKQAWDADPVMNQLAEHIGREVSEGLKPDLVSVTGDLAFSGKVEEYARARQWLEEQLWPVLRKGLRRDRLLLVPGNHDVDRKAIKHSARAQTNDFLDRTCQQTIAEVLADPEERAGLFRRHSEYVAFYNAWFGTGAKLPWWERTLKIRGNAIHVVGLDSAWLSAGDEDYGKLLLSQYQLNQLLFSDNAPKDPALRIALVHHPWSYLAEFDQNNARALIHQYCDLVLRGHLHQPQTERILPPDPNRACLELAAGCVFDSSDYPNAYQWVELWPAEKRVKVHFRVWRQNQWMTDRNVPGCEDGVAEYRLGAPEPSGGVSIPPAPQADFIKYLNDLWEDTAHIDIRGLVTGTPHAHRFPIEDLYIELSASGAEEAVGGWGENVKPLS